MRKWVARVKDKNKIKSLLKYGEIIFISKYVSVIGIKALESSTRKIAQNPNVISIRPSEKGNIKF